MKWGGADGGLICQECDQSVCRLELRNTVHMENEKGEDIRNVVWPVTLFRLLAYPWTEEEENEKNSWAMSSRPTRPAGSEKYALARQLSCVVVFGASLGRFCARVSMVLSAEGRQAYFKPRWGNTGSLMKLKRRDASDVNYGHARSPNLKALCNVCRRSEWL